MSGATWVINQPSGAGAGIAGTSRTVLWVGKVCNLAAVAPTGTSSFLWELLYKPPGSSSSLSSTNTANTSITLDVPTKSYRIRLTTDGGGPGNVMTLILCCTKDVNGALVNRGWRTPAKDEQSSEMNEGGNVDGYVPDYDTIIDDILANVPFVGGPGGFAAVDSTMSPYDVLPTDLHIDVNTVSPAGAVTIMLPTPDAMRLLEIKDGYGGAAANNITVDGNGYNIDGVGTKTIAADYGKLILRGNGSQWGVLNG